MAVYTGGWRGDYSLRWWCQGVRVPLVVPPDTQTPPDPDHLT
jgi:hypothetical protein